MMALQITRRDEEMAPFVAAVKRNYIFGGICSTAANASVKVLLLELNIIVCFVKLNVWATAMLASFYLMYCLSLRTDSRTSCCLGACWCLAIFLSGFSWYEINQPFWGSADLSEFDCSGAGTSTIHTILDYLGDYVPEGPAVIFAHFCCCLLTWVLTPSVVYKSSTWFTKTILSPLLGPL